jgi:Cdc6-like AAA superfamily ATPase
MSIEINNKIKDINKDNIIFGKLKKTNKYLSINPNDDNGLQSYDTVDEIQPIINPNTERSIYYCVGGSGSGKTTYIKKLLKSYKKNNSKGVVVIISAVDDGDFDEFKNIIKLSPKKLSEDQTFDPNIFINDEVLKNSFFILDDVDTLIPKERAYVWAICNSILQIGRHNSINLALVSHQPSNYSQTRIVLNEAHYITVFRRNLDGKYKSFLEKYFNIDKNYFKKLLSMKTRWITISKLYPSFIFTSDEAFMKN